MFHFALKNLDQHILVLKYLDLMVYCFHLLILLAVFILTCIKLSKRKKRRGRLGDCKKNPKHSPLALPVPKQIKRSASE